MFLQNDVKKPNAKHAVKAEISMKTKSFNDSAKRSALYYIRRIQKKNVVLTQILTKIYRSLLKECDFYKALQYSNQN